MVDVLAQIVEHKRAEVARAKAVKALETLREACEQVAPPRDFFTVVTQPCGSLRVIAEVKKASPSAGLIRPDFDPLAIARAYHAAGAAAISCLTDEHFFQGSLAYIDLIKRAVPLPVLRKDFIIDAYQVYEARAAGADAVLLIAECLVDATLTELMELAGSLGLTTLLEVHDRENLLRVRPHLAGHTSGQVLLGINNRDLKAMRTDLNHTLDLLELVADRDTLVSESGIKTPQDIARLAQAGVHRVLVGEHLMRQPDVAQALRHLMTPTPVA